MTDETVLNLIFCGFLLYVVVAGFIGGFPDMFEDGCKWVWKYFVELE